MAVSCQWPVYTKSRTPSNQRNFLLFFLAQALFVVVFSLPFWVAAHNPVANWTLWTTSAVLVWLVSVVGESTADRQLSAHRNNPTNKGKTCRSGLWRYSRHPNYFFEWLFWVGLAVLGLSGFDWRTALVLVAPVSIYWLLVHVSGIPPLERHMVESRGEAFRAYQRRVSAFFPRPPRADQADSQRDSAR